MPPLFSVRVTLLSSGERLPLLMDRITGMPLFEPTVYSITELRARNLASNSIESSLRAISVLYLFLHQREIILDERLKTGTVLDFGEIEELVRLCRLPMTSLYSTLECRPAKRVASSEKTTSLECFRIKQGTQTEKKTIVSAAMRVRYIRDYLRWLVESRISQKHLASHSVLNLSEACARMTSAFNARIPSTGRRNTLKERQGLHQNDVRKLLDIIDPQSTQNPWLDTFTRLRNQLAIFWLYELGLRRGELLGLQISNINFQKNTVTVKRNADSKLDPRRRQPLTKTLDRILPISERLAKLTSDYVILGRNISKLATTHDFLFVATHTGAPLSLIGLNKIFETLRKRCPELPAELKPHVLRHTLNDLISKRMDELKISESEEQKIRSQLMGWSPTSKTAGTYTKRHVREKAEKISLEIQNKIINREKNENN